MTVKQKAKHFLIQHLKLYETFGFWFHMFHKETGGHHSVLTSKKPNRLKDQQIQKLDQPNTEDKPLDASSRRKGKGTVLKYTRTLFLTKPALRKPVNHSLTLGIIRAPLTQKGNTQLQPTLAILSHLRGWKKLRNTCKVHSPEAQVH